MEEMQFQDIVSKIHASPIFKEFSKKHPNAKPYVAFITIDCIDTDNKKAIDYMDNEIIYTFSLQTDNTISLTEDKLLHADQKLEPITLVSDMSLEELELIVKDSLHEQGVPNKLQKIIAVLQSHEDKEIWNCTCILDQLFFAQIKINNQTKKVDSFEKRSIADIMQKRK